MTSKSISIFVLSAGVVAGALVYDGMSRRHAMNNVQTDTSVAASNAPADRTNAGAVQPPSTDSAASTTNAQNPATDAAGTQTDANAAVADATQADASQPTADTAQPAPAQPIVIPAGTALTVRLGEQLGSSLSESNQSFSATLDRDVVIGGQTVIGAGASVTGKVVLARPSGSLSGEANLQLKITSVSVNNADLSIASSIQSFGPKIKGKSKVGRFMKGLVKRAEGDEHEVVLAKEAAYNFTLKKNLQIE